MSLLTYQDLTIEGKAYNEAYYDYWNSITDHDGSLCPPFHIISTQLTLAPGQLVDAVIMPVAPHAAVIPGKYYHTGETSSLFHTRRCNVTKTDTISHVAYTECINLMDYSVAVIPVTKANKMIDRFDHSYKPLNEIDRQNWEACE